jgi:hypothetical protein
MQDFTSPSKGERTKGIAIENDDNFQTSERGNFVTNPIS